MHLKVLFSFHFPLHLKSLVFLHFSFIPRLACAESDYNTLNLQETQSSPKCSLGSPYMCSLALSCNNCCHPRVSSCVQVPLRHTASPSTTLSLQNEFRMGSACTSPLLLCTEAKEMPCQQGCPALLFQAQSLFCRKGMYMGLLQLLWRNRDGGIPTHFFGTSLFPLLKAELSNHSPGLIGIFAKAPLISARPWSSHPRCQVMTASAGRSSGTFVLSEGNTVLSLVFTLSRKKVV